MDAILFINPQEEILEANSSFEELFGYSIDEITKIGLKKFLGPAYPEFSLFLEDLNSNKKSEFSNKSKEFDFQGKSGQTIPVEISLDYFKAENGKLIVIFIRDLSSLKQARSELKSSNKRFRSLVENAAEALFVHDFQGKLVDVNKQACESLGYTRDELLHLNILDIEQDFDLENAQKEWSKIKIGEPYTLYGHQKRKNGTIFPVEVRFAAIEPDGEKLFMGLVRDITERVELEESLKHYHEWISFAQKAAKSGFWDWDMITDELTWTPELYDLFGIPLNENPSFDIWLEIMHPDDKEKAMNNINQAIAEHKFLENEYRVIRPDGEEVWIRALGSTNYDEKDRPLRMSGICLDISSLKEEERILRESEERYHSLFENMLNGFAYCKMIFQEGKPQDFIYLDVNKSFEDLTGLKDVTGKYVSEVIPGIKESDPELFETYGRVALSGKPEVFEIFLESLQEWFSVSVYSPRREHFVAVFDTITPRKEAEEKLKKSLKRETFFGDIIRNASLAIAVAYPNGSIGITNKAFEELTGYSHEELKSIDWSRELTPVKWQETEEKHLEELLKTKKSVTYEKEYIRKDGSVVPIELVVHPHFNSDKNLEYYFAFISDLTERNKVASVIKESESKYRVLFEKSSSYLILVSAKGELLDVNESAVNLSGLSKEELIGKNFTDLSIAPKSEIIKHKENISKVLKGEQVQPYESTLIDNEGKTHYIMISLNPLTKNNVISSFHVICNDITDLKLAEKEIKKSLQEKELLLQEIHHRVKNNMQIISSLLNLQSYNVTEEETKDILKDSQGRIKAMSMVHEKLYQSPDLSHVNFKGYIEKLVYNLFYSYEIPNSVKVNIDIDDIELNMETTIPLGLIINELVTNSLKFAFPDNEGSIYIILKTNGDKHTLTVSDDGVGFNKEIKIEKMTSLGLQLVNSLVNQLDGSIDIDYTKGAKFTIKFQEMKYKGRI